MSGHHGKVYLIIVFNLRSLKYPHDIVPIIISSSDGINMGIGETEWKTPPLLVKRFYTPLFVSNSSRDESNK